MSLSSDLRWSKTDGQLVIASADDVGQIAAGQIVYVLLTPLCSVQADQKSFGYTGLQMLQQIVIADMTNLQWRYVSFRVLWEWLIASGLVTGLISAPFIINNFIAAEIAQAVLPNWWACYLRYLEGSWSAGDGDMQWYIQNTRSTKAGTDP
jgi:hypothetical protein